MEIPAQVRNDETYTLRAAKSFPSPMLLTATRIHDGRRFLPQGSTLEVSDDGTILAILAEAKEKAQHHSGILTPGFVNAHCHLELSHLRGAIPQHTGLIPFLQAVVKTRQEFSEEDRHTARHHACDELLREGIVAVGDIANTPDTTDLRARDDLHLHTFVEAIGFNESNAELRFAAAREVFDVFESTVASGGKVVRQSIVPHAPYSVSEKLFRLISEAAPSALLSVHNQETEAEREWYTSGTGPVRELLSSLGLDLSQFTPLGKSSLSTYSEWIASTHALLLVHNVDTTADEVVATEGHFPRVAWCLCPGANLYIEGRLPNVPMLAQRAKTICLGTDSLASNTQLSILAEMWILREHFPEIGEETLLRWATLNGAVALRMDDRIGSFEIGKKPGVLLLDEDFTSVRRLA